MSKHFPLNIDMDMEIWKYQVLGEQVYIALKTNNKRVIQFHYKIQIKKIQK